MGASRDELVAQAMAAVGVDDPAAFGAPTWQEGLDRLLDDRPAARLNEAGDTIFDGVVVEYLANRAAIEAWRAEHPDVEKGTVERPVVIVGQPRTGTTILFDLLAQDPALRAPLTWEVDRPVPPPRTETYETDPRIAEVQATLEMTNLLIPGFTDFHALGAQLAQECVRITGGDFRSMIFQTQFALPEYNRWLLHEADLAPAYRWHRRYLQHLQSEHHTGRWLLKSPAHLWHLPALLAEYPDALVVQTHRDPLMVIASISALVANLRSMASDHTSIAEAAASYADDILLGLDRGEQARADGTLPADQVVDVQFHEFVADPLAAVAGVYEAAGLELSADAERRMRDFLASNPGDGGGGGKRYRFSDTGLDPGPLRERTAAYQEARGVPSEELR